MRFEVRFFKKHGFRFSFYCLMLMCCIQNCQTADFEFSLLPSSSVAIFYFAYDVRNTQTTSSADCFNGPTNRCPKCFKTKKN